MQTITIIISDGKVCLPPTPHCGAIVGIVDPEGVQIANPGALYWNTTNKSLWVKDIGTDANGWERNV